MNRWTGGKIDRDRDTKRQRDSQTETKRERDRERNNHTSLTALKQRISTPSFSYSWRRDGSGHPDKQMAILLGDHVGPLFDRLGLRKKDAAEKAGEKAGEAREVKEVKENSDNATPAAAAASAASTAAAAVRAATPPLLPTPLPTRRRDDTKRYTKLTYGGQCSRQAAGVHVPAVMSHPTAAKYMDHIAYHGYEYE